MGSLDIDEGGKICALCGKPGATTKDHVPPKVLLPFPLPSSPRAITVPAHSECNRSYKEDDEYFAVYLLSNKSLSPRSKNALKRTIRGLKKKESQGFLKYIQLQLSLWFGKCLFSPKNTERFDRTLKRYVGVLMRKEFDIPFTPPENVRVLGTECEKELFDDALAITRKPHYEGIFEYSFQSCTRDKPLVVWELKFYESASFFALVNTETLLP